MSDVVSDGVDGVLIPPGDPQRLAEELQRLHIEPRPPRRNGDRGPGERRALRLAADRRSGRARLRAGDRSSAAGRPADQGGPALRLRTGRRPAPRARRPDPACRSRSRSTRAPAAAASPAASASASAASSGSGSPISRRSGSASTASSRAPSAPTWPGSWSPWRSCALRCSSARRLVSRSPARRSPPRSCAGATSPRRR